MVKNADSAVATYLKRAYGTFTADPEEMRLMIRDAWRPIYNLYELNEPPSYADFWGDHRVATFPPGS